MVIENPQRMKRGGMYKSQKEGIITYKCNRMETRTKYKESRYFLNSKSTDYQMNFCITSRIMTRKRSINWEVVSIEVIKKSLLSILESSEILVAGTFLPRNTTKGEGNNESRKQ